MNKKAIIPVVLLTVIIIGSILYFDVFRHIGDNKNAISGSGTIEVTEIEIASKIAGKIAELPYEEGAAVKKGSLIVKLDYGELAAQLNSMRANMVNTEANLARTKELIKTGSVSQRDYDNADAAFKIARANFDLITANIANAVILSPLDGTVIERNLELGEMAFPGSAILTLGDLEKPWMKIYVSEKQLGMVKIGQKAGVSIDSYPNRIFDGRVVSISSKAEFTPKTIQTKDERVKLMFAVKLSIDNPEGILKPGMPADAILETGANP